MNKNAILLILIALVAFSCSQKDTGKQTDKSSEEKIDMLEKNKQVATTYHDLNAENIDVIFTDDFIGRGELGHTWDKESHRKYLSNGSFKVDSITHQVAEGEWVSTMFVRTMDYQGERTSVPVMHFKRFEGNKIAEVWEYYDFNIPDPEEE